MMSGDKKNKWVESVYGCEQVYVISDGEEEREDREEMRERESECANEEREDRGKMREKERESARKERSERVRVRRKRKERDWEKRKESEKERRSVRLREKEKEKRVEKRRLESEREVEKGRYEGFTVEEMLVEEEYYQGEVERRRKMREEEGEDFEDDSDDEGAIESERVEREIRAVGIEKEVEVMRDDGWDERDERYWQTRERNERFDDVFPLSLRSALKSKHKKMLKRINIREREKRRRRGGGIVIDG